MTIPLLIDASVTVRRSYTFGVRNGGSTAISRVRYLGGDALAQSAPSGWRAEPRLADGGFGWMADESADEIQPGRSLDGFSFTTDDGPRERGFGFVGTDGGQRSAAADEILVGGHAAPTAEDGHAVLPAADRSYGYEVLFSTAEAGSFAVLMSRGDGTAESSTPGVMLAPVGPRELRVVVAENAPGELRVAFRSAVGDLVVWLQALDTTATAVGVPQLVEWG